MPGPFLFKDSGCFTGPLSLTGNYDYDASSLELVWATDLPTDTSFSLTDVASVLFANQANYLGHYLFYNNTSILNLGHSTGSIPVYIRNVDTQIQNGSVIQNGSLTVNGATVINGLLTCNNVALTGTINVQGWKSFDIPHPTKENHRLVHACLEGPEVGVYYRGKLVNSNVIDLPEYWRELVDLETITVNLTPHGVYQELFVKNIEWGTKIKIVNNSGGPINCSYVVYGKRKDVNDLVVEYEGQEIINQDMEKK